MAQQGPKKKLLVKEFERIGRKADELIIHAPGILALGDESLLPPSGSATDSGGVFGALCLRGDVVTTTYPTHEFDPGYIARQLADMIVERAPHYKRLNIIGSSMGGLLAVDALAELSDLSLAPKIRPILVDSPFGASDLMSGGNIAAPVLRWTRLGQLPLLQRFPIKGGPPKPHEVQADLDFDEVKRVMMARMEGFTFGTWAQDMAYMDWRFPAAALLFMSDTRYVRCTLGNETVRETAVRGWMGAVPGMKLYEVASPHCGYAQQPEEFIRAFAQILAA